MKHLKLTESFLARMRADHERIKAQIEAMADNPTAYHGETLISALTVLQWHLREQAEQLDWLAHKAKCINQLIDQADDIYQGAHNDNAE